ncbi:MAG: PT domain-containing protein [Clostridia bacterium]|nr:PT domain-containing protein [Clostridia bacterium]
MKKVIAILLSALLLTGLAIPVSFAEEAEDTNYLTHKWASTFFGGTLTEETDEDGTFTRYIPASSEPWLSPQLSVYDDLKKIAEGKDFIEVYFRMELRGVYNASDKSGTCGLLFRAIDPRSGSYAYKLNEVENWDGQGNHWLDLYGDLLEDGDVFFKIDGGGNVMSILNPQTADYTSDDWTVFESEPMYIPTAALSDELFGDIILCFDFASNSGYSGGLKGIDIRNTAIYDCNEHVTEPDPTEEPTEQPVDQPTDKPADPTSENEATAPAGDATAAPVTTQEKTDDNKSSGLKPGAIIGIIAGAVVVVGVIVAVIVSKKKKK